MVERLVDLHVHTNHSDGALSPLEVIELAHQRDVASLSITDHDTVAAHRDPEVKALADDLGVDLVPGIEISSFHSARTGLHVLGYYVDPNSSDIQSLTVQTKLIRRDYANEVANLMRRDGWILPQDQLDVDVPTKATIADAVIGAKSNQNKLDNLFGETPSRGRLIEALMNENGQYFVERRTVNPGEAIDIIHGSGGVAFLAHPVALMHECGMTFGEIKEVLQEYSFDGLEAIYYYYAKSQGDRLVDETDAFIDIAKKLGLLVSGGSDFHGHGGTVGNYLELGFTPSDIDMPHLPTESLLSSIKNATLGK